MIFIHGVYFGSDDEINLAHNEGFLFELFRDIGVYNSIDEMNDIDQPGSNLKKHFENNPTQLNLSIEPEFDDDEDFFAIDKVAQTNTGASSLANNKVSTSKNAKKSIGKSSNISFNTLRDYNSEHSSLNSVNKESFCQNYINESDDKSKNKIINKNKQDSKDTNGLNLSKNFEKSSLINNSDIIKLSSNQLSQRKMTPPGDVLATINKWLTKTKYAIELRNKQLEYRSTYI